MFILRARPASIGNSLSTRFTKAIPSRIQVSTRLPTPSRHRLAFVFDFDALLARLV